MNFERLTITEGHPLWPHYSLPFLSLTPQESHLACSQMVLAECSLLLQFGLTHCYCFRLARAMQHQPSSALSTKSKSIWNTNGLEEFFSENWSDGLLTCRSYFVFILLWTHLNVLKQTSAVRIRLCVFTGVTCCRSAIVLQTRHLMLVSVCCSRANWMWLWYSRKSSSSWTSFLYIILVSYTRIAVARAWLWQNLRRTNYLSTFNDFLTCSLSFLSKWYLNLAWKWISLLITWVNVHRVAITNDMR